MFLDDLFVNYGVFTRNVWCYFAPLDPNPTINLTFTNPVVITGILSGGLSVSVSEQIPLDQNFVNNFTIEYMGSAGQEAFTSFGEPMVHH